jgi:acyl homoserine lactone synthase
VWELTRLAIDADRAPRLENGISELTCVIFREVLAFAREQGIRELVAVVSLPVERIFRRLGLPIERLGHRQAVDLGAVRGVGIRFHLDERFDRAVHRPCRAITGRRGCSARRHLSKKVPGPARDSRRSLWSVSTPCKNGPGEYLMNLMPGLLSHLTGRPRHGPLHGGGPVVLWRALE